MSQATEQIAAQYANAALNKKIWGNIMTNAQMPPYNARGNNTTDDTSAIQAAIDAVYEAGGGAVMLPLGYYRTTSTIVMKPKVFLVGPVPANMFYNDSSHAGSVIRYEGTDWAIRFPEETNASQSGIINLNILGNEDAQGGIMVNETEDSTDPSLDLYFSGIGVSQFSNGYGVQLINSYRNIFYSPIIRQCGCGFSTLQGTNDITIIDPTIEWCALGASFVRSVAISITGILAEGLGVRPDVDLPSDLFVWSDYSGRTLSYYHGGIRNFGSTVSMFGGYMEDVEQGDTLILELDAVHNTHGVYFEFSAESPGNYLVHKAAGAQSFTFIGNRVHGSPTTGIIFLDNAAYNCTIMPNSWSGTKSVPFFVSMGSAGSDGGLLQAPEDALEMFSGYGANIFSKTVSTNASFKLLGTYTRSALDNYWEWYRQDGDGPDKFLGLRRRNSGVDEFYWLYDASGSHPVKPLVFDNSVSAASAPLTALFRDSADGKLKFKDAAGSVHSLY